eukprot:COSAG02_NODE_40118_length_409_cov_0.667742_1_plen_39_part_10
MLCCITLDVLQCTPLDRQPRADLSENGQDRDEHTNPVLE